MNDTPPSPPTGKKSGLAVWSLILGILALVLCLIGPLFGIPAVICGHMGLSRIKQSAGILSGRGLAIGGLITGYLSIAMIPFIALLAAIAIPNFTMARNTAFSNACVNNMRQIDSATQQWALETGKKDTDAPDPVGIQKYIIGGVMPTCPKGGNYVLAPTVGTTPPVVCPNETSGARRLHKLNNY